MTVPKLLAVASFRFNLSHLDSNDLEAWKPQAVVDSLRKICEQRVIETLTGIESAHITAQLLPRFESYLAGEQAKLAHLKEQQREATADHQAAIAQRDTAALTLRQLGPGRHTQLERDVIAAGKTAERSRAEAGQLQDQIRRQSDLVYRVSATLDTLKNITAPDLAIELPGLIEALKSMERSNETETKTQ